MSCIKGYHKSFISANIFNFYLILYCFLLNLCGVSKLNKKCQHLKCDTRYKNLTRYKSFNSTKETVVLLHWNGMLLKHRSVDQRLRVTGELLMETVEAKLFTQKLSSVKECLKLPFFVLNSTHR